MENFLASRALLDELDWHFYFPQENFFAVQFFNLQFIFPKFFLASLIKLSLSEILDLESLKYSPSYFNSSQKQTQNFVI